jgi:hypothetical protein
MTANKPLSPSSINVHDVPYNILKFQFHNFDHCFPEFVFILEYQRKYDVHCCQNQGERIG